jgi:membrane fusion protein (multidrug efflux system)
MLLRVGVEQGSRQALAVPESAVLFEGDAAFVYVVAPGVGRGGGDRARPPGAQPRAGAAAQGSPGGGRGGGLRAERRPVETGARQDGLVEVVSGLKAGERIVADGLNRVNPNQPVRIAGEGAARGAGGARGGGGPGAPAGASGRPAP